MITKSRGGRISSVSIRVESLRSISMSVGIRAILHSIQPAGTQQGLWLNLFAVVGRSLSGHVDCIVSHCSVLGIMLTAN